MTKAPTPITITDSSVKYGLLQLRDREEILSIDELELLLKKHEVPGKCSTTEWEDNAVLYRKVLLYRQAIVQQDDTLLICYKKEQTVNSPLMLLYPNEWEIVGNIVYVDKHLAVQICRQDNYGSHLPQSV